MQSKIGYRCLLTLAALFVTAPCCIAGTLRAQVVDTAGAPLRDAVVALHAPLAADFSTVATAVMDQRGKQFDPRVLAVRQNTSVRFPNSDDIRHQVYSFSPAKRFELRLYHGQQASPVLFDKPGEVALGCNIHDGMVGYIYVVDSPWFAQSDQQGLALIADVPAGSYSARLWYPGVVPGSPGLEQAVKISASGEVALKFQAAAPAAGASAPVSELQQLFQRRGANAP